MDRRHIAGHRHLSPIAYPPAESTGEKTGMGHIREIMGQTMIFGLELKGR